MWKQIHSDYKTLPGAGASMRPEFKPRLALCKNLTGFNLITTLTLTNKLKLPYDRIWLNGH